ncbi:MAG: hypothetical protein M3N93_01835, partial [Acidobacteriota bacterium]|nr:hypothetical protein [Acidobacteriota bacterium]
MPPWPADPEQSLDFSNDARLTAVELAAIAQWVDEGAPRGSGPELGSVPVASRGWSHPDGRDPDLVISMPGEFRAPSSGEIPHLSFLARLDIPENKWVSAIEVRPGNPRLVHHMALTEVSVLQTIGSNDTEPLNILARQLGIRNANTTSAAVKTDGSHSLTDMLAVFTPGSSIEMFQSDAGKIVRSGPDMYLDFNIHYEATGKPETDRSQIALWFSPEPPKHQLYRVSGASGTIIANGHELFADTPGEKAEGTRFSIPPIQPGANRYRLVGLMAFETPATIYSLHPHAHRRAKSFEYKVVLPTGKVVPLLRVPRYD